METVAILLLAGIALILLETILPGLVAGTVGLLCVASGIALGYVKFGPTTGNLILLGVLGAFLVLGLLWIRYFPNSRVGRMFVTNRTVGTLGVEKPELLGQTGRALTHLRPSGTALIGGKRVDVVTEGSLIERDTPVRVVAVEGMRVVVRQDPV